MILDSSDNMGYQTAWRDNIFSLTEIRFYEKFRMNKTTFKKISHELENRSNGIKNFEMKFLVFLSDKSSYRCLRELFGLSSKTIWSYVNEMNNFIYSVSKIYIHLPSEEEFLDLKQGFQRLSKIQNTILSIDGAHVKIQKPSCENSLDYYNMKGFYSLNYLTASDYKKRVVYITFAYGSAHDSRIFRYSTLSSWCENLQGAHVVGDLGYRSFTNVKTPIGNATTQEEKNYNKKITKQRIKVEHTYGMVKSKF